MLTIVPGPFTSQAMIVNEYQIDLEQPWGIDFLPDGSMLITERRGTVQHLVAGVLREVLRIRAYQAPQGPTGLQGLAVDPDFLNNQFVYLYYQTGPDNTAHDHRQETRVLSRLSRFTFEKAELTDEQILLDNIPGSLFHTGGQLKFGPDGMLYLPTGDAQRGSMAPDPSFLGGKILRMRPDGTVPEDNPIAGSMVFSMGHRNPRGLAWHPLSGDLYQIEHGNHRYDEINRIRGGSNYGWMFYKCDEENLEGGSEAPFTPPIFCAKTWTLAPSGMEIVADPDSPWYGDLFVTGLRSQHLRRFRLDGDAIVTQEIFFAPAEYSGIGIDRRLRNVKYHKGSLYVIGDNFGLVKITPR
jgi:glucose/arabinose dehydrogenase